MPLSPRRRHVRSAVVLGAAAVVATAGLAGLPGSPTTSAPAAAAKPSAPDALLRVVASGGSATATPPSALAIAGSHRRVALDTDALPAAGGSAALSLPGDLVVDVAQTSTEGGATTWEGSVEGQPGSSFALVRDGDAVRGQLIVPGAAPQVLSQGADGSTWWTTVAPQPPGSRDDAAVVGPDGERISDADAPAARKALRRSVAAGAAPGAGAGAAARVAAQKKGKAKIKVLFGFTKAAKAEAGGKGAIKAAARLVVAQTNQSFANSGIKAKVKFGGVVQAKGKESSDAIKNAFRVARKDGKFDNLIAKRRAKRADLVHLITVGSPNGLCGGGLIPLLPRFANPNAGAGSTFLSCVPYLVVTHELGHNFGADHDAAAFTGHVAKTKYSYGYANPAGRYTTIMSYDDACIAVGVTCPRVPAFSSPKNTYNGLPLGDSKKTNNTKAIKQLAPRVARYFR